MVEEDADPAQARPAYRFEDALVPGAPAGPLRRYRTNLTTKADAADQNLNRVGVGPGRRSLRAAHEGHQHIHQRFRARACAGGYEQALLPPRAPGESRRQFNALGRGQFVGRGDQREGPRQRGHNPPVRARRHDATHPPERPLSNDRRAALRRPRRYFINARGQGELRRCISTGHELLQAKPHALGLRRRVARQKGQCEQS